jgi:hypothetical protein
VSIDFITSLPRIRRYDSIMVCVDRLSKHAVVIPTTIGVSAQKVAELFFARIVSQHGLPTTIVSDRDSKFTSTFWAALFGMLGTKLNMSTAYNMHTDGQTERMNRLLEDTLRHYVNDHQSNWVTLLPMAEFAINNAHSSAIQSSPFYLNTGQHPHVPGALVADAAPSTASSFVSLMHSALTSAKKAMAKAHDRMRSRYTGTPLHYTIGQLVLLSTKNLPVAANLSAKLLPHWDGPFEVLRCIDKGTATVAVELQVPAAWKVHPVFSTSLIKPYYPRASMATDIRPTVTTLSPS